MKITFILPGIGKKPGEKYIGTWKMEPLTIATLSGLTPVEIERRFFDDRIEGIDFDDPTDLVVITVETYTARRAYEIAERYRQKNVPVILGGYHVTLMTEEAAQYGDTLITGNAEQVWDQVLSDWKQGVLKSRYKGGCGFTSAPPDRSVYKDKKYLPLTLVETGRGCPFNCEFCAISSYYCRQYAPRPIPEIVAEIKASGGRYFFLVDDNIVAQPNHAKALFEALKPLNIKWTSQGSLTMAKDPELLKLMRESGCDTILIGFESLDETNLQQMKKEWNAQIGERDQLIDEIHKTGIGIYATFVFGFDNDQENSFKEALAFSQKHGFFFVAFNHLLPFPGTALYKRLHTEGRLLSSAWWLENTYHYGDIPYRPTKLSPKDLGEKCTQTRRAFYTVPSIFKRAWQQFKRNKDLFLMMLFLTQNLRLRYEVEGKNHIPIGAGLDEGGK